MSEKRGRGQPKFEPTQDQRSQVKLMNRHSPDSEGFEARVAFLNDFSNGQQRSSRARGVQSRQSTTLQR